MLLPYTELNKGINSLSYDVIRTNKKIEYINMPCSFDIETTSVKVAENKAAFMYVWALSLGQDNPCYYGRTWDEFISALELLSDKLQLHEAKRLVVYVHNLGYEFQFMRKHFTWLDVFAIAERKPIKALCSLGIEFRCSYILSGYSLANTAKNMTKHKIKKLVGDLDYSLTRTHKTPLTDAEFSYLENDVLIVTAYIDEQLDIYKDITKIPLTNTGRVRNFVRNQCYYTSSNHRKSGKGKYIKYRKIMGDLTINPEIYPQMKRAFMGGFTHSNARYSGKLLENVSSIDFTSSYPSVMVSERFPMSRFKEVEIKSIQHLDELCSKHALIFDIKFTNIRCKISQENYISESKCFKLSEHVLNNGRIHSAKELATTITEIDYDIIKQVYEWDSIEVANVQMAYKNYLPKAIIESVLKLYEDKTVLKDVEGYEVEYLLSKGMLNSVYGMSVTDIVKDNSIYTGEWLIERVSLHDEIEKYNEAKSRFLYYPWGLWVTAYARRNLWSGILAVGDDYVYSDTDSLKLLNYDKHVKYIQWFDNQMIAKLNAMADFHKIDKSKFHPKTKTGKVKTMGVWDFEGTYSLFKTLGAKRYMYQLGDKIQITVAGLSKQNGLQYMLEQCGNDPIKTFEMFDSSLYVPADRTGKMTHTYIDEQLQFQIVDYLGEKADINTASSIHLENCDFTLSISEQYKKFLNDLSKGYLLKGVKHK